MALVNSGGWSQTEEEASNLKLESVQNALARIEADMSELDEPTDADSELSMTQRVLLGSAILSVLVFPSLGFTPHTIKLLVPTACGITSAVAMGAEFSGKSAVSNGIAVGKATAMAAAESEILLARSERVKAILPVCIGLSVVSLAFALLAPRLVEDYGGIFDSTQQIEFYLASPLIGVLSASVAGLASQESIILSKRATQTGVRRFARAGDVGRTWMSVTELVESTSASTQDKWLSFTLNGFPGLLLGAFLPGEIQEKAIAATGIAGIQTAFSVLEAEYGIARGVEAVALKTRAAAISETYAFTGKRSSARLPQSSALAALSIACSIMVAEACSPITVLGLTALAVFPAYGAIVAASATVPKTRCEVDAEAAAVAGTELTLQQESEPVNTVLSLLALTLNPSGGGEAGSGPKAAAIVTNVPPSVALQDAVALAGGVSSSVVADAALRVLPDAPRTQSPFARPRLREAQVEQIMSSLTSVERTQFRALFNKIDRDASGEIDAQELRAALATLGAPVTIRYARTLIRQINTQAGGSGDDTKLNFEQFLTAVFNKPAKISKRKAILNFLGLRRDNSLSYAQQSL